MCVGQHVSMFSTDHDTQFTPLDTSMVRELRGYNEIINIVLSHQTHKICRDEDHVEKSRTMLPLFCMNVKIMFDHTRDMKDHLEEQ